MEVEGYAYQSHDESHLRPHGLVFIDNARIKVEHLKNRGIHLNGDGVSILAANFINQALKVKIKAGKRKRKQDPLWLLAQTLNKMIRTSSES